MAASPHKGHSVWLSHNTWDTIEAVTYSDRRTAETVCERAAGRPAAEREESMQVEDFTKEEQQQIKKGLSTAQITDQEAADKILALVPQEWIRKIPFFVRKHATTKTVEKIAHEHPDLYAVAKQKGELPAREREQLQAIVTGIFEERMKKHNIRK